MADHDRVTWHADLAAYKDEPLALALIKYQMDQDRHRDMSGELVSSHLYESLLHMPIIDLDAPHLYTPSTTDDHAHLYLNVAIPRWRLWILLWGLRVGKVIEQGFFWWSLRRGGTFVRRQGVKKLPAERFTYSYGMFFKTRE